jgi:hypothetical protein
MKIIDQTPFYNKETGDISILDRVKGVMKFGATWQKEVEAQKHIITVLANVLDNNFTLLRNVIPPHLETSFPFILIGPPGVFVMYVTPLIGMFRARGDQWGTISGNAFKNEKPNLLTRTERMARAIHSFLQRQGYTTLSNVDGILLCSDPSVNVDSIRPIIRVVMCDALERFAISLTQARVVLNLESIQDITSRILNPPKPAPPQPIETPSVSDPQVPMSTQVDDSFSPAFSFSNQQTPVSTNETPPLPVPDVQIPPRVPQLKALNKKQWIFLLILFLLWCLLISIFLFLVISDQTSFFLSLLP